MRICTGLWKNGLLLTLGLVITSWAIPHGKKDWPAPEEAKKLKNPLSASEPALRMAKAIYDAKCAQCHGDQGKGDGPESIMYDVKPADLTDTRMMNSMPDGEIFWKISEGRQPMPSFRKQLTEEQRWQLVHFLRSFAPRTRPAKTSGTQGTRSGQAPKPSAKKPAKTAPAPKKGTDCKD